MILWPWTACASISAFRPHHVPSALAVEVGVGAFAGLGACGKGFASRPPFLVGVATLFFSFERSVGLGRGDRPLVSVLSHSIMVVVRGQLVHGSLRYSPLEGNDAFSAERGRVSCGGFWAGSPPPNGSGPLAWNARFWLSDGSPSRPIWIYWDSLLEDAGGRRHPPLIPVGGGG